MGLLALGVGLLIGWLAGARSRPAPEPRGRLTERETDLLRKLATGLTTKELAAREGVRPSTIRTHVKRSCRKLGVPNRTAAVACVMQGQAGAVPPRPI